MWNSLVELIDLILSDYKLTEEDLDKIIEYAKRNNENLYLEVKHGDVLKKPRAERSAVIRKYSSGFANSVGGILVIGVDEGESWSITGCPSIGNSDLAQWAAKCNTVMEGYFSPPPVYQVVNHSDGNVLVIAIARSSSLVTYYEKAQPVLYLRYHDSTKDFITEKAPDYLRVDILTGRRSIPYLVVREVTTQRMELIRPRNSNHVVWGLKFTVVPFVENQGFIWARTPKVGLVHFGQGGVPHILSSHLSAYISPYNEYPEYMSLYHKTTNLQNLSPFERFPVHFNLNIMSHKPDSGVKNFFLWKAALYIIAENTPPVWYQIALKITPDLRINIRDSQNAYYRLSSTEEQEYLTVKRIGGGNKTIVAFEPN